MCVLELFLGGMILVGLVAGVSILAEHAVNAVQLTMMLAGSASALALFGYGFFHGVTRALRGPRPVRELAATGPVDTTNRSRMTLVGRVRVMGRKVDVPAITSRSEDLADLLAALTKRDADGDDVPRMSQLRHSCRVIADMLEQAATMSGDIPDDTTLELTRSLDDALGIARATRDRTRASAATDIRGSARALGIQMARLEKT